MIPDFPGLEPLPASQRINNTHHFELGELPQSDQLQELWHSVLIGQPEQAGTLEAMGELAEGPCASELSQYLSQILKYK